MSAALLRAVQASVDELARQWPQRYPALGDLPGESRERIQRALASAAQLLLQSRLCAARSAPLGTPELRGLVEGIRGEADRLEQLVRRAFPDERHLWLAEVIHGDAVPWLEESARVALAGIVTAIECIDRRTS